MQGTGAHDDKSSLFWLTKLVLKCSRWIPGLTRYRFNIARHHQLLHGQGGVLLTEKYTQMYVGPGQLSHVLNFITSGHIIQDIPLGEKKVQVVV